MGRVPVLIEAGEGEKSLIMRNLGKRGRSCNLERKKIEEG